MNIIQNDKGRFYLYKDRYVPSVTTVLKCLNNEGLNRWRGRVGNVEADRVSEEARDFGQEVHTLTQEVEDGGLLDHENPLVVQLAERYLDWVETAVEGVLGIEVPLVGELDGMAYGGTVDRVYRLKTGEIAIVDIKTSKQCNPEMGYQLEGLKNLFTQDEKWAKILVGDMVLGETGCPKLQIVRLKKNDPTKKPQIKEYCNENDLQIFRDCLSLYYLTKSKEIPK